jgi:hypothetical protein
MNKPGSLFAIALLSTLASPVAVAGPADTGALNVPANRIVGLWRTDGIVAPCGVTPFIPIWNTLLFQAGGTVVENAPFPPEGVPNIYGVQGINQRNNGIGTWSYDPSSNRYAMQLRFDWFVDNVYHGYMTIDRDIQLSSDGMQAGGPVWVTRFAADGSVILPLCGEATSTRLQ